MKTITLVFFLSAFLLLRPYQLQSTAMLYSGDDYSYMAHATSLVFFQFPSYAKESFELGGKVPLQSIGPSLLASPFVFAFSVIDRICGHEIVLQRTSSNILESWAAFGYTVATLFYAWLTCLLLYQGLTLYFPERISSLTVILALLAQGIPLYIFRRPVFSHIYEIFLQSLLVYFLLKLYQKGHILLEGRLRYWREACWVGLVIGLITLVRQNNMVISLAWPVVLFMFYRDKISWLKIFGMIAVSYLVMLAMIFVFQIWPVLVNFKDIHQYQGYLNHEYIKKYLMTVYGPLFYIKRLGHLLWGIDWGLVFTAPFALIGLVSFFSIKKDKLLGPLLWLLLVLSFNLYVTLSYRQQGAWYGYRYLIFSLIPLIVYPLANFLTAISLKNNSRIWLGILLLAIVPVLSMLSFEGNTGNLTLKVIDQGFGVTDWGNNTYQLEIYKTLFLHPVEYFICIIKGGPLYLVYLASHFLGHSNALPAVVKQKYIFFETATLIKTLMIYLLPFVLLFLYKRSNEKIIP